MCQSLDRDAVKDWIFNQQAAADRIEKERVQFLLALTQQRSLQIYLDLWNQSEGPQPSTPSPLLIRMRQALARKTAKNSLNS
jgi:hypothetical protein